MTKKISFIPSNEKNEFLEFLEIPSPSKNYLPKWYKNKKRFDKVMEHTNNPVNALIGVSYKACVPFFDTFISGYTFSLHQDIVVTQNPDGPSINWNTGPEPVILRTPGLKVGDFDNNIPTPLGCAGDHWAWKFYFGIKVPKGYSVLITHPLNRYDLPFISASGIVDELTPFAGSYSFWLKEGFEGIIPKGTPLLQLFPYKRDDWESEVRPDLTKLLKFHEHEIHRYLSPGYYKKFFHRKKSYR